MYHLQEQDFLEVNLEAYRELTKNQQVIKLTLHDLRYQKKLQILAHAKSLLKLFDFKICFFLISIIKTLIYIFQQLQKSNLHRTLFLKLFFWDIVILSIFSVLVAIIAFAGPLVIKRLLSFLTSKAPTNEDRQLAYMYTAAWIALYFVRIFLKESTDRKFVFLSIKTQALLSTVIFEKLTRISPCFKKYLQKGDILNHLTTDVKYVGAYLKTIGSVFAAPTTIVTVQVFLFIQVGSYGLILLAVLIFAGIIQICVDTRMSRLKSTKLNILEQRIGSNMEFTANIKELKLLGWEDVITEKNKQYLQKENDLNKKYFWYMSIFDLLISMIPGVVLLLIYILYLVVESSDNFNSVMVYTIMSFVGMVYSPMKTLFNVFVVVLDGTAAINRINHLLNAEQVQWRNPIENDDEKISLYCNNPIGTWYTEQSKKHFEARQKLQGLDMEDEQALVLNEQKGSFDDNKMRTDTNVVKKVNHSRALYQVTLENPIELKKGDTLFVIGEPNSGKSTFMQMIIGNCNMIGGEVFYSGTIGYLPQKPWFKGVSVRRNIKQGSTIAGFDLQRIYHQTLLVQEFKKMSLGDKTIMKDDAHFSDVAKKKIGLARLLARDPDIMLLDQVFGGMDPVTAKQILDNIRDPNKISVISTNLFSIIEPNDKVLIFDNDGKATQYGTFSEISQNPSSIYHRLKWRNDVVPKQIPDMKNDEDPGILKRRELMRRILVKIYNLRHLSEADLSKHLAKAQKQKTQSKRVDPIAWEFYLQFFKTGPFIHYVLMMLLTILTYAVKVFSDWWIGNLKKLPWALSQQDKLFFYLALTVLFALFFILSSTLRIWVSLNNSTEISGKLAKSISRNTLEWYDGISSLKAATRLNRDQEQIFNINNILANIVKNVMLFLLTLMLVGLNSLQFTGLGIIVIVIDLVIVRLARSAQREIYGMAVTYNDVLLKLYGEITNGLQTIKSLHQTDNTKSQLLKAHYDIIVQKYNYKSTLNAMITMCDLTSLAILAGVALIAIGGKDSSNSDQYGLLATSITYSLKIGDIVTNLVADNISLQNNIKGCLKAILEIIQKAPKTNEKNYDKPPSCQWPSDYSIEFQDITLKAGPMHAFPEVNKISFTIKSGQHVVICGNDKSGKSLVLQATTKLNEPVKFVDGSLGKIKIGGEDIEEIGRKYISKKLTILNSVPFTYTATIQENLDPLGAYQNERQQLVAALKAVGLWDKIEVDSDDSLGDGPKLGFVLKDAGSNLSLGLLQKLNYARAILKKPGILVVNGGDSSMDETSRRQIMEEIKKQCKQLTILEISEHLTSAFYCDRILYMHNGRVKEHGQPTKLIQNPNSLFSKFVKSRDPGLYNRVQKDSMLEGRRKSRDKKSSKRMSISKGKDHNVPKQLNISKVKDNNKENEEPFQIDF